MRTTVYSGEAGDTSARVLEDVKLEPGGFHQYSGLLGVLGVPAQGYVKVERVEGRASFLRLRGDQRPGQLGRVVCLSGHSEFTGGGGGADPAGDGGDECVHQRADGDQLLRGGQDPAFQLRGRCGVETPDRTAGFSLMPMRLEAGEQRIIPDTVVGACVSQGVAGHGSSRGFYTGAVFATAVEGDMSGIVIGARTGSQGGGGQYSVFYNAVPFGEAFSREAWVEGLQQNRENRSNLALVNTGEVDGSDSVFHPGDLRRGDGPAGRRPLPPSRSLPGAGIRSTGFWAATPRRPGRGMSGS